MALTTLHGVFRRAASLKKQRTIFNTAFDKMQKKIAFGSEEETIRPENVEITKQAFVEFLHDIGAPLSLWSFEELLGEKSGKDAYRADGKTPNWYHEFRNIQRNLSKFRTHRLHLRDFVSEGGLDVFIASILRHDSWEDFGKSPTDIITSLNAKIYNAPVDEERKGVLLEGSHMIAKNVDRATRKTPKLDDNGNFVLKPSGKIVKEDRFEGDQNIYYNHVAESPVVCLLKFEDAVEGMSTRIGVENFSIEDDKKYTQERRALFGARQFKDEVIEKFAYLKRAIRSSDGMLGILLRQMETQLYYVPEPGKKTYQNPVNARPCSIADYAPHGPDGYETLSPGWHPEMIFLERMETKAAKEQNGHTRGLLDYAIYPGIDGFFARPHNYVPPRPEFERLEHNQA